MNKTSYKWYLSVDDGETLQRVYPVYKGDLAIEYEQESGEIFHRPKLSGKLDFVGNDYDWIMAKNLAVTTFTIIIDISIDRGATYTQYWKGIFTFTDMEVNVDDKKIIVQPQVWDEYTTLLDYLDTEYDLFQDIAPKRSIIRLLKKPILQIYSISGSIYNDYCDNIQGGEVYQEETANDAESQLQIMADYKFGMIGDAYSFTVTAAADENGNFPSNGIEGTYVGLNNSDQETATLHSPDTNYYIYTEPIQGNPNIRVSIYNSSDVLCYQADVARVINRATFTLTAQGGTTGKIIITACVWGFYGRWLCDTDAESVVIDGQTINVQDRPSQDLTTYTLNYKRIIPIADYENKYIAISARVTNTYTAGVTEYGKNSNGQYFLPPSNLVTFIPINKSNWEGNVSLWIKQGSLLELEQADKDYTLNDAFSIDNVINGLLYKITDGAITHQPTTAYSQFLYGTNPISETRERLFLTPKSNILSSEYSQAAQKGTITLKMVLDMLKKVYQCYWWVEQGKLRIEHISYFIQGKSYTEGSTATISYDLTTLQNTRNGKWWDFGKNNYTFEKIDMPERIIFKWMDDVISNTFAGSPILLQSPFVERAKKDEQSISNFTSDISRMLALPSEFGKDGFALLTGEDLNLTYIGTTLNLDNSSYPSIGVYAAGTGTEITLTLTCTNSSGQPQGIEYGWYLGEHNILGYIPSDTSAVTSTITIIAPDTNFSLYFHTTGAYSATVRIDNIVGGGRYSIQKTRLYTPTMNYLVQNYHLSLQYLLPTFWKYNLACAIANINGQNITTTLVKKGKIQSVKIPIGNHLDPDPEELIKTSCGIGTVRKMSVSLSSRVANVQLKQDTI